MSRQPEVPQRVPPVVYAESPWWKMGDPPPVIDAERPELAQAVARCIVARLMPKTKVDPAGRLVERVLGDHPRECNWCAYRIEDLQRAVGRAEVLSRHNIISGEYENEAWARFFVGATPSTRDLDPEAWKAAHKRRFAAIEEAQYGGLAE